VVCQHRLWTTEEIRWKKSISSLCWWWNHLYPTITFIRQTPYRIQLSAKKTRRKDIHTEALATCITTLWCLDI
jgi:hypothetical protein